MSSSIRISAVMCTYNEERWLPQALTSLAWTEERIVCDMGSTDRTRAIAEACGASVITIPRAAYIEQVRAQAVSFCSHEWILFSSPDFIFPAHHKDWVLSRIAEDPSLTCINMLHVNYFGDRPVVFGKWGPRHSYPILFKRNAMELPPVPHNGFKLVSGSSACTPSSITLKHMWTQDHDHFTKEHLRNLLFEGIRRLESGIVPSTWRAVRCVFQSLLRYMKGGLWHGRFGSDLLLKELWYDYRAEQMVWLETITGRKADTSRWDIPDTCTLFYNYYCAGDSFSRFEIDYCLSRNVANRAVKRVVVLTSDPLPLADDKIEVLPLPSSRPTFAQIFQAIGDYSGENDCNIIINADCILATDDPEAFTELRHGDAWCIGRYEIPRVNPLLPWTKRRRPAPQLRGDMQDCWIIRGKPAGGMWLDFTAGVPGCDNRLAYELQTAGYDVQNPMDRIKVYHMHQQRIRTYTDQHLVPKPYLLVNPSSTVNGWTTKLLPPDDSS